MKLGEKTKPDFIRALQVNERSKNVMLHSNGLRQDYERLFRSIKIQDKYEQQEKSDYCAVSDYFVLLSITEHQPE